jgi:hypothetical protein
MVVYDMIHGFMTACIWAGGEFVIALRAILSNRAYMEYKSAAIAHITDTKQTSRQQEALEGLSNLKATLDSKQRECEL